MRTLPSNLDPPEHAKYRQVINPPLSPGQVARLDPAIRRCAEVIADEVSVAGSCEFMNDVALRLPAEAFLEQMGLPLSIARPVIEARLKPSSLNQFNDPTGEQLRGVVDYMNSLFAEVLAERRARPQADVPSHLLTCSVDDRPLTDAELLALCYTLLGTSLTTTASTAAFGFKYLAEHPDFRARLVEDPSLVPGVVEEFLRYFPAIPFSSRTVTEDVEFHDVQLKAGDRMVLALSAANRDARQFSEPHVLDPGRSPNRHVGFGMGPHRCAGASLARVELRSLIEVWHDRIPDYHLGDMSGSTHEVSIVARLTSLPLIVDSTRTP